MSCSRLAACCRYESSFSGSSPARRDGLFSICSRVKYHLLLFSESEVNEAAITEKDNVLKSHCVTGSASSPAGTLLRCGLTLTRSELDTKFALCLHPNVHTIHPTSM